MKVGIKAVGLMAFASAASAAYAYLPPIDETNGVRIVIQSFDQFYDSNPRHGDRWLGVVDVDTASPRAFTVMIENRTSRTVDGELSVVMNEDWEIAFDPTNGGRVAAMDVPLAESGALRVEWLTPCETRSFAFVARARPTVVDGLYPVHARFVKDGAGPHAVGVFHAVKRDGAGREGVSELARMKGDDPDAKKTIPGSVVTPAEVPLTVDSAPGARWKVTPGARGLSDATLGWSDGKHAVSFAGFDVAVRGKNAADASAAPTPSARATATGDVLRITVALPDGATRPDGFPRLASVMPGGADSALERVYFGFGNVLEGVERLTVNANGFELSTRHIGADYANGVSVVQATDVIPDAMEVDPDRNLCSIRAPHDVTFTFVAGTNGAFAAAKEFAAVSSYSTSPGHDALVGRMCLDEWFTYDYDKVAGLIEEAGRLGLNRCVFVKHAWQRWCYDVRLPDIWPPVGGVDGFRRMCSAAQDAGMLFVPHDNYTDFYPDADGFSYDHIAFKLDGSVQESWYNDWMHSLAVRWAPGAYLPWTRRNARLLRDGVRPDGIFIDVLTCLQPFDWLDRAGRYHSRQETSRNWGAAFAAYREEFGDDPGFVTISEAGQDHLVGVVDGGQSDHLMAEKAIGSDSVYADAERVPWHDMVTHGKFVLFAGGLAQRYLERRWGKGGDAEAHGYGSDDYLSTTVIGGRNPMCGLLDFRKAVKTYWLQQAVCEELSRAEMLSFEFGPTIHQQHAVFSGGAEVWVNRSTNTTWRLANGVELPSYGYYTKSPECESGIVLKSGRRARYAKCRDSWYVEAPEGEVDFGGIVTDGAFRLDLRGERPAIRPLPGTTGDFSYDINLPALRMKGRWRSEVEP